MKAIFAVMNTTWAVVKIRPGKKKKKKIQTPVGLLALLVEHCAGKAKVMGSVLAWISWTNKTLWFLCGSKGDNGVRGINTPGMRIGNTMRFCGGQFKHEKLNETATIREERTEISKISETDLPFRSARLMLLSYFGMAKKLLLKFLRFIWTFNYKSSLMKSVLVATILVLSVLGHSSKWISI